MSIGIQLELEWTRLKISILTADPEKQILVFFGSLGQMRVQPITRLPRGNNIIRLLPQRRLISTTRELDQEAEQTFISNATSTPAASLLKTPNRDTHAYDTKPPITFSTPVISALHARIGLPSSFPLTTLTRCLTDPSVDEDHQTHNEALSVVGNGLLDYYVSEYLAVRWPRLPMKTQLAALWAYTGESALARISREWGVQPLTNNKKSEKNKKKEKKEEIEPAPTVAVNIPETEGDKIPLNFEGRMDWEIKEQEKIGWIERSTRTNGSHLKSTDDRTYEEKFVLLALQRFVQALIGGVYVHSGIEGTQSFIKEHILSRTLPPLSSLYIPASPAQELTRLCERLKIPLPVSRLIAESGRRTRTPVFVVGVYSGREKLGEGQGQSLREAKVRANSNALRAWYLYEQMGWEEMLPSRSEVPEIGYKMGYVDPGSIVL